MHLSREEDVLKICFTSFLLFILQLIRSSKPYRTTTMIRAPMLVFLFMALLSPSTGTASSSPQAQSQKSPNR